MSDGQVFELDDANFDDEVYGCGQPVLVEFFSEGSYSCRELSGIVDDLADEYAGKVRIGRLDVEANWQTARTLEVSTVPAVLLFQNDRIIERIIRPKTREEYRQALNELVTQYWVI
ncbi:MAG: thioredoxin family protein [Pirellulaceae bacterium]